MTRTTDKEMVSYYIHLNYFSFLIEIERIDLVRREEETLNTITK
jgi:hypothetical protein